MAIILPTSNNPSSEFNITLSEEVYTIKLRWVTRTARWYIAVETLDGIGIIDFEKATPTQRLINYNEKYFPDGNLYVLSSSGEEETLGRDNFGSSKLYKLLYFTNEELVNVLEEPIYGGLFLV